MGGAVNSKPPKEIILVDDDKYSLETLSKLLTEDGYKVVGCLNGKEALEKMKNKKYDIIITDLRMPEMGGIELLKNIKKINPEISVIIITAFGEVDTYLEAIDSGAFDYIHKPINYEVLLKLLRTISNRK